jgi:hypothetical protein
VARPPSDEDPPPFSDAGWRLWRAAETLEEYHEDLRTLYVACTRAMDFLVLSAPLPEPFSPASAWTLALENAFDLTTGRCQIADLASGESPHVRVVRDLAETSPSGFPGARAASAASRSLDATAVVSIPVRLARYRIVSVAEIESLLRGEIPVEFGRPFDAEDGSDLHHWGDDDSPLPTTRKGSADSELLGRLSEARCFRRDVEFLLAWPPEKEPHHTQTQFGIRGAIDVLWQDNDGWHLLVFHDRGGKADSSWYGRKPGLTLAAWAVRQEFGHWPKSVSLYNLQTGEELTISGGRLPHRKVKAAVEAALARLTQLPEQSPGTDP